ncbi:MAG TPA: hypothetical protein VG224_11670 [Reyranella sp.]|nr:hypothetical protein [Reyranella sp.]
MRNIKWLVAATFAVSMTGCVEMDGYPTTSYGGGYPSGYGYSNGYAQPTYYQPAPVVTRTRYVPVPVAQAAPRPYHHDWDKNRHWHS